MLDGGGFQPLALPRVCWGPEDARGDAHGDLPEPQGIAQPPLQPLPVFCFYLFFFFRWYLHFISPTVPIRFLDICSGGSRAWEISPPGACISMSPGGRPLAIYCVPFGAVTGNTPAVSHPFKSQYLLAVAWLGRLPLRSRVAAR